MIRVPFSQPGRTEECIDSLLASLSSGRSLKSEYALLMAGIPAAVEAEGERQLAYFLGKSGLQVPVLRYRRFTGEFASASAVAAAMAVSFLAAGAVPGRLAAGKDIVLGGTDKILVLGLGPGLSAMEFSRPAAC